MADGYRVGVYSSPHLVRYTERVRIQGKELPEALHTASEDSGRRFQYIELERNVADPLKAHIDSSRMKVFKIAKPRGQGRRGLRNKVFVHDAHLTCTRGLIRN